MPQEPIESRKGDNNGLVRRSKRPMFNKVEDVGQSLAAEGEDAAASMRFVARDEGWKTQD